MGWHTKGSTGAFCIAVFLVAGCSSGAGDANDGGTVDAVVQDVIITADPGQGADPGTVDFHEVQGEDPAGADVVDDDGQVDDLVADDITLDVPEVTNPCEPYPQCDGPDGADCRSAICVPLDDAWCCTEQCIDECPDGWTCQEVDWQGDIAFYCVKESACIPSDPPVEVCDWVDNDCDGETDEGVPKYGCPGLSTYCCDPDDCDRDHDGWLDPADNCPCTPNPEQGDCELDGLGDACDPDDDDDGILDEDDNCVCVANFDQWDCDDDGYGNACDGDMDGDSVPNEEDNCPFCDWNPDQADCDGDDMGDVCDPDDDNDTIADADDNCHCLPNIDQADCDGDGIGDACDPVNVDDGIPSDMDNCPDVCNTAQKDLDDDGIGDACDPDIDGDGDPNLTDCAPLDPAIHHGVKETCNGIDDDCDGTTDPEDTDGCEIHYADCDQDEYGAMDIFEADCCLVVGDPLSRCLCQAMKPYTALLPGDCKDCDPFINPAAVEVCDYQDNDCDGQTDEEDATGCSTFYMDFDHDGYGMATDDKCLCASEYNYTATKPGDCDDQDPLVNPGVPEACNCVDDDCDGVTDEGFQGGNNDCNNDGIPDGNDNCPCVHNPGQEDLDGDGVGDACDCDIDGDTVANSNPGCPVPNPEDNCPFVVNPGQEEGCDFPYGAACDPDVDCDGVLNEDDNCPWAVNPAQVDCEDDGIGDACDDCIDCDDDGICLEEDCDPLNPGPFPGNVEFCNGIDDNCNGQTDEANAVDCSDYFFDQDEDGWGTGDSYCLCEPTGPYSATQAGDCDDGDVSIGYADTQTDPLNCGECFKECDLPDTATHTCHQGECRVSVCDPHYHDCNGIHSDGCEEDLGYWNSAGDHRVQNTCDTAVHGGSVCGDQGNDEQTIQGIGTKWVKFQVQECSDWDADLHFAAGLNSTEGGYFYDLLVKEGACSASLDGKGACDWDCVDDDWSDAWGQDDDKWIYVLVHHVSGKACTPWTLRGFGFTVCTCK